MYARGIRLDLQREKIKIKLLGSRQSNQRYREHDSPRSMKIARLSRRSKMENFRSLNYSFRRLADEIYRLQNRPSGIFVSRETKRKSGNVNTVRWTKNFFRLAFILFSCPCSWEPRCFVIRYMYTHTRTHTEIITISLNPEIEIIAGRSLLRAWGAFCVYNYDLARIGVRGVDEAF